jgi:hypothetical protein
MVLKTLVMKSLDADKNALHIRTIFFLLQSREKKATSKYFKLLHRHFKDSFSQFLATSTQR